MARTTERSREHTGRHDALAALAAGTAVVALAGTIFLAAGGGSEQNARQPDTTTVDDRSARLILIPESADDARWAEFLAELDGTIPESTARAAGEQACLYLRGNAGEGEAVDAILAAGVPPDEAVRVLDASRRYLCP